MRVNAFANTRHVHSHERYLLYRSVNDWESAEQALLLTQLDHACRGRVSKTVFKGFETEQYGLNRGPCFHNNQPMMLPQENKELNMNNRKPILTLFSRCIRGIVLLSVLFVSFYFALAVVVM